jgi:hypothetical protein
MNGIAMSSNGKYLMTTNEVDGCFYSSSDYGVTWTQGENCANWNTVAMSADGKYRAMNSDNDGYLYLSSDYGAIWTSGENSGQWNDVAMSLEGKYQIGVGEFYENESSEYRIMQSSDYGETWDVVASSTYSIGSVAMSADGKYRVATRYDNSLLSSSDYGATWEEFGNSGEWMCLAMSSDAKYITAGTWGGYMYTSIAQNYIYGNVGIGTSTTYAGLTVAGGVGIINGTPATTTNTLYAVDGELYWNGSELGSRGWEKDEVLSSGDVTWNERGISGSWSSISISSSGQYQTAFNVSDGYLYTSSDYGETWEQVGVSGDWGEVVMSSSGQYQTVNNRDSGYIYISSDYGLTWEQTGIQGGYSDILMSPSMPIFSHVAPKSEER